MSEFLTLCVEKSIVKRASLTALVVGTILVAINYGDAILRGPINSSQLSKIILTVCVPYMVSTISSAFTILNMKQGQS